MLAHASDGSALDSGRESRSRRFRGPPALARRGQVGGERGGDGQAGELLDVEELAGRVDLEEDVFAFGRAAHVDGAVLEAESQPGRAGVPARPDWIAAVILAFVNNTVVIRQTPVLSYLSNCEFRQDGIRKGVDMSLTLRFGVSAPSLAEQLGYLQSEPGSATLLDDLQRDADAITRLHRRGLLAETEALRVRRRLVEKLDLSGVKPRAPEERHLQLDGQ
jgi:hypothetical protein